MNLIMTKIDSNILILISFLKNGIKKLKKYIKFAV